MKSSIPPSSSQSHLTTAQISALWQTFAQSEEDSPAKNRRNAPRFDFINPSVIARISHPNSSQITIPVGSRDLSNTGICFLYNAFLYNQTPCSVFLNRRAGGLQPVAGKIRWCKHVAGPWHAVGMIFDQPIDAKLFVDPSETQIPLDFAHFDPASLKGTILLLDDQDLDRELFTHSLNKTNLKILQASTAEQAFAIAKSNNLHAAFIDLNLGANLPTGEQVLQQLRQLHFLNPAVAVTVESAARMEYARLAGFQIVLQKPYEPRELFSALNTVLSSAHEQQSDPIFSEFANQPNYAPLLLKYVDQVRQTAEKIQLASQTGDLQQLRALCQTLKGTGKSYGFPTVTDAAAKAVQALDANNPLTLAQRPLQQLQNICRLVATTPSPQPAPK